MIKRLMQSLIDADVPDREITRNWDTLGYIGSCMQDDVKCEIQVYGTDTFWIKWITEVEYAEISVRFDLKNEEIIHYINRRGLHASDLTKDNVGNAVVWMFNAGRALSYKFSQKEV